MITKKIVVTGAAGFIGSHIAQRCLEDGHHLTLLDNFITGSKDNLTFLSKFNPSQYTVIEGDIKDNKCCHEATKNCEIMYHQAALSSVPFSIKNPEVFIENNVTGTFNILVAAKDNNISTVIQASSASIYGDSPQLPKIESMQPNPLSPYAVSKVMAEELGRLFWTSYNLPVISLRYFNVFGPRQHPQSTYASAIPLFIKHLLTNSTPTVYGNGEQTRDFIYIDDIVNANIKASTAPKQAYGNSFNIAQGQQTSINQLIHHLQNHLKSTTSPTYTSERKGDILHSYADITKAQSLLSFTPTTSLENGLKKTIEWMQSLKH